MKTALISLALGTAVVAAAGSASAHHSYAMFDPTKTVVINGTVEKWEYTNPHAFLFVYVIGKDGKQEIWQMEAPNPAGLLRNGITRNLMKPGDKVRVELNPLRDGRTGGFFRKVTLEDGRFFCSMPPGRPTFEAAQVNACAGTEGGPPIVSVYGDARLIGNKQETAAPGSAEGQKQ